MVAISTDYYSSPDWYFVYTDCGKKLVKTVEGLIEHGQRVDSKVITGLGARQPSIK